MRRSSTLLLALLLVGFTSVAGAQSFVRGSVAVTPSAPPSGYGSSDVAIGHIIDQSGLSANYTSGVTDFATFTSSTIASYSCCFPELGNVGGVPATLTFDLGGVFSISGIAVWNQSGSASLRDFNIYSGASLLGSYSMDAASQDGSTRVFSFGTVSTQFLTMEITSNYGYESTTLNEVAFEEVSTTPEPATFVLVASGLLGVGGIARKRRAH